MRDKYDTKDEGCGIDETQIEKRIVKHTCRLLRLT